MPILKYATMLQRFIELFFFSVNILANPATSRYDKHIAYKKRSGFAAKSKT